MFFQQPRLFQKFRSNLDFSQIFARFEGDNRTIFHSYEYGLNWRIAYKNIFYQRFFVRVNQIFRIRVSLLFKLLNCENIMQLTTSNFHHQILSQLSQIRDSLRTDVGGMNTP